MSGMIGGDILYATYDDYMSDNYISSNSMPYKSTNYRMYVYVNKYNMCSGYLPDFITLDKKSFNEMFNINNSPRYYPYTMNGKYLKQISNFNSKYNSNYFSKMKFAHKLSRQIDWSYEGTNNKYKSIPFKESLLFNNFKNKTNNSL